MEKKRVVITGLGAVTPVGIGTQEFWDSLIAGKSGTARVTRFDASQHSSQIAAEVKDFDPEKYIDPKDLKRMDLFIQFGMAATVMAVEDGKVNSNSVNQERCGVLIGSGIGGLPVIVEQHAMFIEKGPKRISPFLIPMLIINMTSGLVAMRYQFKGPTSAVATACATGNNAIGDAFKIIQRDDADLMVAGGTEGALTPLGYGGFCTMKALSTRNDEPEKASRPFDRDRDGFVMGEGAGIVILEELEHAKARGARIYCEIVGYGMTADAYHITAPAPEGEGAKRAMELALKDAGLQPEEVDYINAHGTSTPLNDKFETIAIKRVFREHAYKLMVSSTKSMTGHLLGAAGGIETVAVSKCFETGWIPPTINYETPDPDCDLDYVPNKARQSKIRVALNNSMGFGGQNAVLAFKAYDSN